MPSSASPREDGEPSLKRRRINSSGISESRSISPDELGGATPLPKSVKKPRPSDLRATPKISINSPLETEESVDVDDSVITPQPRNEEDSADELDHTFFSRTRTSGNTSRSKLNTLPVPSAVSTPRSLEESQQESEDGFLASSSPVPSGGTPPPPEYAPEIYYKPQLILRGHKRGVAAVKFSPDGKWIASCSADATLKIWSAATGAHIHTLRGHLSGISTLAWSPDSSMLASGSDDKSIRLWRASTGQPAVPAPLLGHHNYVYCVVFSPKGNMLVSGSYDEAVVLWDVRTGRVMRSLPAHSDPVGGVDFCADGTLIVSCASDGLIRVWDTATGQCLRTFFHEDTPPVVGVRFSPNGRYIVAWMLDSCLRMWDYVEGRCVKTYQGHRNKQYSLCGAFGAYGGGAGDNEAVARGGSSGGSGDVPPTAFVVSGSEDGAVILWDVVSKKMLQRLEGHAGPVLCVDTHPTERAMVSCGIDKTIRVWRDNSSSP